MEHSTALNKLIRISFVFILVFMVCASMDAQKAVVTYNVSNSYPNNNIIIPADNTKDYVITGSTTVNTVIIQSGYKGTVILDNLTITSSVGSTSQCGLSGLSCITVVGGDNCSNLSPVTKVNVILKDSVRLTYTNQAYCALQVNQGAQIHISAIDPDNNSSGRLVARCTVNSGPGPVLTDGGGGAAIGAPNFESSLTDGQGKSDIYNSSGTKVKTASTAGGNIIISSGIVHAYGGHGAGIGGGWYTYYNGIIVVYGGEVYCTSKRHSAGIGSGCPEGSGVNTYYAENSAIISLPPSKIEGYGTIEETQIRPDYALAGARNITYMNDPNKPLITVRTEDFEKNATIYLDLTETPGLVNIFQTLEIPFDLSKVKIGKTDTSSGVLQFHGRFEQSTTFFTDASSSQPSHLGRPYLPVKKTVLSQETIVLPLLATEIAFTDYPSQPLELGYTVEQAWDHAHIIKMEYKDPDKMEEVTFQLQSGTDFQSINFLDRDKNPLPTAPSTLFAGDIYYLVLPIETGRPLGVYSDVLLINGKWKGIPLPGYIRRIGMQRVVVDDTGKNEYIKVTAFPNKFVSFLPDLQVAKLILNINHAGTSVLYSPSDVKAKYLITTEADYDAALAANPLSSWDEMLIPGTNGQDETTPVSFSGKPLGTYYIHWYVESGVVYAHSQTVINPPLPNGGFGPYSIAEPVKVGMITGNPSVCSGQLPSPIRGEASTGGSGCFIYQWQMSTDGISWVDVGGNTLDHEPEILTVSPTYYRRMTWDCQYGDLYPSNDFVISIIEEGTAFYWNKEAHNRNWNDPENWCDANGAPLHRVPASCSDVYIPYTILLVGEKVHPSLDPVNTPVDVYGDPVCRTITFADGGELAYQHRLHYEKAYIQYNWGYYSDFSGIQYGDSPNASGSRLRSHFKERNKWYSLAAPLKCMTSGDFSFAGYPLTWQAGLLLSDMGSGVPSGSLVEMGDFSESYATNDIPLSLTNNAIAVKVANYASLVGYRDQRNLQGLQGVLEIPYFESTEKALYYPGHHYDPFSEESTFYYFDVNTLKLLHSPVGKIRRGAKAYRFVYEAEDQSTPLINLPESVPSVVPGYRQKVECEESTQGKVMIGNPFLAAISSMRFLLANRKAVDESQGYYIYSSKNSAWQHFDFSVYNDIPPCMAFVVTLKTNEVELFFPLEGSLALTGNDPYARNVVAESEPLYLSLSAKINGETPGDCSVLIAGEEEPRARNVRKLIHTEGHAVPETFFITSDKEAGNLIQVYKEGMQKIGIGVKSSDTQSRLSLSFRNVQEFSAANGLTPVLLDNDLKTSQNLLSDSVYFFHQRRTNPENNYVDADRFVLLFIYPEEGVAEDELACIRVVCKDRLLEVEANREIRQIQLYDMSSRLLYSREGVDALAYKEALPLSTGVYLVKVLLDNGKETVIKVVI